MTDFDAAFPGLAAIAHRVAYRILGDRSDAEEVTQEALARAFARWSSVAGHAEPWVATVAANLAIGRWRKRRPTVPFSSEHGGVVDAVALERLGLVTALRQLPKRQREVVILRYLADLSEAEVAAQLSTSVGTVKQHAHRGLARLRAEMQQEQQEVDGVRAPG